jgi:hypothetical protein
MWAEIAAATAEMIQREADMALYRRDPIAWRRMMAEREMAHRPGPSRPFRRHQFLTRLFAPLFALAVVLILALCVGLLPI